NVLVPVYLFHRYQLISASKVLGGLVYTYTLRGDNQKPSEIVPASDQRRALKSLLATIDPQTLALPENILRLIPPTPDGYDRDRELFDLRTSPAFDALSAAETAAAMTINLILNPERAARLVEYHARENSYPGFIEVTDALINASWKAPHNSGLNGEIRRAVDTIVLQRLMWLSSNDQARAQVRAVANSEIESLRAWIKNELARTSSAEQKAHLQYSLSQIQLFQQDPSRVKFTTPVRTPAGAPIGSLCSVEP
ncbi:MAG TPA: zinc-dependent metalloprotease, partial [Acidobacteriota bacterium]|nr:zinc-dependent metalloprotease [Acidobacteriota bacterium]